MSRQSLLRIVCALLAAVAGGCANLAMKAHEPLAAPFRLSADEQSALDAMLGQRQARHEGTKSLYCKFDRLQFTGDSTEPKSVDEGELKFAPPDRGVLRFGGKKPEQTVWDSQSIWHYDFERKAVVEEKLPPEVQGRAMMIGVTPLLLWTRSDQLQQQFFLRLAAPPSGTPNQVCLEAFPRFADDTELFVRARLILAADNMLPIALEVLKPDGKTRLVYKFREAAVNSPTIDDRRDFYPEQPPGWKRK